VERVSVDGEVEWPGNVLPARFHFRALGYARWKREMPRDWTDPVEVEKAESGWDGVLNRNRAEQDSRRRQPVGQRRRALANDADGRG